VVSDYQFRSVITDSSLKKKTIVIKNGVDINHFSPSKGSDALKIKLGISKNDFVLVSTAGTAHHKGWLFLAEAIETLDESLRNSIKVILLGNKPSDEILNKNYIKGFIFSGLVEDVRPYVAIADVGFVLSYKVETISYACREMMSMGKPVIVSNFSGLPENINNGINGWIVDAQNIRELRNKILEIINLKDIKAISVKQGINR